MKHIVFIVGEYYPDFSANGVCCFNIAEEIAKENKVTVICFKSRTVQPMIEEYQGQTIIRVTHIWWNLRLWFSEGIKRTTNILKLLCLFGLRIVQVKEFIQILLSKVTIKRNFSNAFFEALKKIDQPIDAIIPLCFPMEAIIAGMMYKKKNNKVKLIPYLFDPFLEHLTIHRTKWNKALKKKNNAELEKEMLKLSSKVFCINHLEEHFINMYQEYSAKIVVNEHPLIKKIECTNICSNQEKTINIFYAGVFDKRIRNPKYFLKLIDIALRKFDAKLHLYSYGNCGDIIGEYVAKSNNRIIDYGFVPKDRVNKAMMASDILICVGNVDNLQVSSKVIECMSVGKPIVLFYTVNDDANLKNLQQYPLSLCLKQEESLLQVNMEKFIKFCQENKGKSINFNDVEKRFYYATPHYIAKQMMDTINYN